MILPYLTVLSQSWPRRAHICDQVITPPTFLSSSRSFAISWLPFCYTSCPPMSSLRIRWPAHLHLAALIFTMISFTWVCFLISVFQICSLIVMLSILLSIALCAVISFCSSCLVVVHVSAPYVIVGITHWSNILLLRDIGILRSQSISLNLPKQLHPAFILIITSSRVWFAIITVWPRYLYTCPPFR